MATTKYKKAAERLSLCCGGALERYGMTIATLDGCIELYRQLRSGAPLVETVLQDEAKFFEEMGFQVDETSVIAWRIWG